VLISNQVPYLLTMEIQVQTRDGRKMSFRSAQKFQGESEMLATFLAIHKGSIESEGWTVASAVKVDDESK